MFKFTLCSIFLFALLFACQSNPYQQGEWLYLNNCANCHMDDGSGLGTNIPPLAQTDYLPKHRDDLACIIRYGIQDTLIVNGKLYSQPMAGITKLNETEITNIINYIHHAWGNDLPAISIKDVKAHLDRCEN